MSVHQPDRQMPAPTLLARCPVCGADAQLWHFSEAPTDPVERYVACTHSEAIGPQSGLINSGCLLYMPPRGFYQPTDRAACDYWNNFALALTALREERHP